MKPHEERVHAELMDLTRKVGALRVFMAEDVFPTLEPEDQALMHCQLIVMEQYVSILQRRCDRFD